MTFLDGHPEIKVVFTLGLTHNSSVHQSLEKEQRKHCDIVQFNFYDNFFNVSLKTAFELHYLYLTTWDDNHGPPELFFLAQDDIYINVPRFVRVQNELSEIQTWKISRRSKGRRCEQETKSVYGHRHRMQKGDGKVITGTALDNYLLPHYIFAEDTWDAMPPLMVGIGGFYPRETLPCLIVAAWHLPILPVDDQWTALLFRQCEIVVKHIEDHSNYGEPFDPSFMVSHLGRLGGNPKIKELRRKVHSKFLEYYHVH